MTNRYATLAAQYRKALLDDVIPFWERHSIDRKCGGYFTCLNRDGSVYDTDKFMWLQGRQVWTFSMLYNRLEKRPRWLEVGRHGGEFLRKHGRDKDGNWYFSLTREGRPLVQPYNIFADFFAAMGFSEYARATGDDEARRIAERSYRNFLRRRANPKGRYSKAVPGARPLIASCFPMGLTYLTTELAWLLDKKEVDRTLDACAREVFSRFIHPKLNVMQETVAPDGSQADCFDGRLVDPGHSIEAMWFLMDAAERRGDTATIKKAVEVMLSSIEFGWDRKFGGIFYFLDTDGHPPDKLEWDQKLWWVHIETLIALVMAFRLTGRKDCWRWFEKVHDYTWRHFPDPKYGEWFGYLNRRGEVLLPLKGGKWKGCFHVPRGLYLCMREFEKLSR
jgi:N-acylglucosamine 2-epimerase